MSQPCPCQTMPVFTIKFETPGSYDGMHILDLTFVALPFLYPICINHHWHWWVKWKNIMNSSFTRDQSILVFHSFPSCFATKGVFGVLTDFTRAGAIGIPMFRAGKTVKTSSTRLRGKAQAHPARRLKEPEKIVSSGRIFGSMW